jgi:integrase
MVAGIMGSRHNTGLSDTRIRAAKPRRKAYKLPDGNGLHLEVSPTGARLWRYRYRIGGKENMFAIGSYPEVSLAAAREERDKARKLAKDGIHPSHKRKTERIRAVYEGSNTFKAIALEWLAANKPHWALRSHRQRERILELDIFPHIGALPMRQVTPAHAHAILRRMESRAPQMAVLARQCISSISRLAIMTMRADVDIAYPLRSAVKVRATQHKTPLRVNQIPAFFKALERSALYFPTKAGLQLMWLTLARPAEVIGATWEEFDLENAIWTIPAHRMKMRQPHAIPLPSQAMAILKLLRAVNRSSEYLIPNRNNPRKGAAHSLFIKALYSLKYTGKFTPHGIRVTGRTLLGEQGHDRDVLERQLAHRDKKEVRAYDQGDRLEARRKVMQGWANYLDGLCAGANIVNIKVKAS